jgi:hypothetical protein
MQGHCLQLSLATVASNFSLIRALFVGLSKEDAAGEYRGDVDRMAILT